MLFRLIGKLYFYFCVVPFIGKILKTLLKQVLEYSSKKNVDSTWTWQKQHAQNVERLTRPRRHYRTA